MNLSQLSMMIKKAKKANAKRRKKKVSNRVNNKAAKPIRMKYHR